MVSISDGFGDVSNGIQDVAVAIKPSYRGGPLMVDRFVLELGPTICLETRAFF